MKSLALYLLLIFALTCVMLEIVHRIDPPEPVVLVDATPAQLSPCAPQLPRISPPMRPQSSDARRLT